MSENGAGGEEGGNDESDIRRVCPGRAGVGDEGAAAGGRRECDLCRLLLLLGVNGAGDDCISALAMMISQEGARKRVPCWS